MRCPARMTSLPSLPVLIELFNKHTNYECRTEKGGVRICVADVSLWFPEDAARDLLWRILRAYYVGRVEEEGIEAMFSASD